MRSTFMLSITVLMACGGPTYPFDPDDPDWADIGRSCRPSAPAMSLSQPRRDSLDRFYYEQDTPDVTWARIARIVPGGFAGVYVDRQKTILLLVEPERKAEAIQGLTSTGGIGPVDLENARVRAARWDFGQLFDWSVYVQTRLPNGSGASAFDIDETRNRISILVLSVERRRRLESHLAFLGLPCFLVAVHS